MISYDEIPRPSPGPGDSPLATHFVARNDPTQLGELASLVDAGRSASRSPSRTR
ncbi:hypothetical protein [Nonomuraea indica]|uniref:Uncharacterized protein n=1 Tax=Nonomuraea indica TaxID=1581193 RepID=A0ABW8A3L1_9ACTN